MTSLTLAVPKDLKQRMDQFREINWSEVARQAFNRKLADLEVLRRFSRESELTEADAIRMGRAVNRSLAKRYGFGR